MAMLIAWHTVNAVRHPNAKKFSRGFLIVAPGITIKDRLRVLQPNDPESYYKSRELVPEDMLPDLGKAKIVITNYHAFKKKDEVPLNKVQRSALRTEPKPESDGAMIRRLAGELMGLKNIVVLNDEAHHCYRERPLTEQEQSGLKGDDLDEAKKNNEAARLPHRDAAGRDPRRVQRRFHARADPRTGRRDRDDQLGHRRRTVGADLGTPCRDASVLDRARLADWIVKRRLTDGGQAVNVGLVMQMRTIVRRWMNEHLVIKSGTQPAQVLYNPIAERAADRIMAAITRAQEGGGRVLAILDPYNREGSTRHVSFMTSKDRYETGARCHVILAVIDSDWEAEFCRVADQHPAGAGVDQEPQPRLRVALCGRRRGAPLPPRLHPAPRRRARAR